MTYGAEPTRKPHLTIGYTTRRHLLLDLDNTTRLKAERLARQIQNLAPETGDALILISSSQTLQERVQYSKYNKPYVRVKKDNYHIVFDNAIGYNKCVQIIDILADLNILNRDYKKIRGWRGDMTLRVSPVVLSNKHKPIPTIVSLIKNPNGTRRDGYIWQYLNFLNATRTIFRHHPSQPRYKPSELRLPRKRLLPRLQP